jgi:hypothetical protein
VAEIKVQRKKEGSRKWPWVALLLIPLAWFAWRAGGDGKTDAAASDTTKPATASATTTGDTTGGTKRPNP